MNKRARNRFVPALCLAGACLWPMAACQVGDDTRPSDDYVWLTVGSDALGAIDRAMELGTVDATLENADPSGRVSVIKVSRDQLADLSNVMHDEFHRCGGYVAHESLKVANQALDLDRADQTINQTLVTYSIDNSAAVQALRPALDQQNLVSIIQHLSTAYTNRYHTTQDGIDAAMWIRDTWQGYIDASGRTDASVQLVQHSGTNQPSVVLTIQGDTLPDEVVVVGGHLDSTAGWSPGPNTSAPGADDDASGVATVSEIARTVLTQGFYPDRTVKFMAYAAEEVGLVGSGEIAQSHASQGINVVGVMQLDMVNYQGSNQDIVLMDDYTNAPQNNFITDLIDTYLTGLTWTYSTCGYGCSDHASWHNRGFPASIPFESLFNDYNPYIHSASDTLANSDPSGDHAMKFADLGVAYVAELAKGDFTDDTGPDPDPDPDPGTEPVTETFSDSVARNAEDHFGAFAVEPGTTFQAVITGTNDADLYVRMGAAPTTSSWDCRPYKSGSSESCTLSVPAGETEAYVMVRGYSSSTSSYTLTVTYTPNSGGGGGGGGGGQVQTTESFSDSVSQGQNINYGPFTVVPGTSSVSEITGTGDADLYVRVGAPPTTSSYDCRPYKNGSAETCTVSIPAGETELYVMVRGYTSATYDLDVTYYTPAP